MMNANSKPAEGHLDELVLDALRAGEGSAINAAHATSCPRCRAALARLAGLEARLKGVQPTIPEVPRDVELRIFRAYRASLGKPAPAPFAALVRRWALPASGLAAAAVAALALRLTPPVAYRGAVREPARVARVPVPAPAALEAPQPTVAVDIVDAFRLARALRDGRQVASGWDTDGNGTVDAADVQAVARRAVAL